MKPSLLYLANDIPFPPDDAQRIRSFQILRVLSKYFNVSLASFIQEKEDWQYTSMLRQWCQDVFFLPCPGEWREWGHWFKAVLLNQSFSSLRYKQEEMQYWINSIVKKRNIQRVYLANPIMAHYLRQDSEDYTTVVDFSQVPSEAYERRLHSVRWPRSAFLRWEYEKLQQEEINIANQASLTLCCDKQQTSAFKQELSRINKPTLVLPAGVDGDFFDPKRQYKSPYPKQQKTIVFTGTMDYWPNIDAVTWFAKRIFPTVRAQVPDAHFYIVGSHPTQPVAVLTRLPGVHVVGSVPDLRPYLACADVAIAPMQFGERIQSKVLEAISMAVPFIASPQALEGLSLEDRLPICTEDTEAGWRARVAHCLTRPSNTEQLYEGRQQIISEHTWEMTLSPLLRFLGVDILQPKWLDKLVGEELMLSKVAS